MTTRSPFVSRDLYGIDDGAEELYIEQPTSHQFAMMTLDRCQDFLYVFGGRWNWPRLVWRHNLLTGTWTKVPIRSSDIPQQEEYNNHLQWTIVPFFALEDDANDNETLMAMLPVDLRTFTEGDDDAIELCTLRIVLARDSPPYTEIKSVPYRFEWPRGMRSPIEELVGRYTGDTLLGRSDGRQFYHVPSDFDHCAEISVFEYDNLSKKWRWRRINQDIKEDDPVFGAIETMSHCSFIPFLGKWHGQCAIFFLGLEKEEDLLSTEKSREEHLQWMNPPYCAGTESQKRLLIFTIDAQKWSVVDVHPDATFGYPIYRAGAAHDVAEDVFYLVGGIKRNMYLSGHEKHRVFDEIWTLNLATFTWNKLVHCRLQTPVFNATAKYSTETGSLFVFGGVTVSDRIDFINNCSEFVKPPIPLQRIQIQGMTVKRLGHICAEKICKFVKIPSARYSNTNELAKICKNLYF